MFFIFFVFFPKRLTHILSKLILIFFPFLCLPFLFFFSFFFHVFSWHPNPKNFHTLKRKPSNRFTSLLNLKHSLSSKTLTTLSNSMAGLLYSSPLPPPPQSTVVLFFSFFEWPTLSLTIRSNSDQNGSNFF